MKFCKVFSYITACLAAVFFITACDSSTSNSVVEEAPEKIDSEQSSATPKLSNDVPEQKNMDSGAEPKKFFVQGDPLQIVYGTKMNGQSFLTKENLKEFDDYELINSIFFEQLKKIKPITKSVEEENAAPAERMAPEPVFFVHKKVDGGYEYHPSGEQAHTKLVFGSSKSEDGRLEVKSLQYPLKDGSYETLPVQPLHYSIRDDKSAFSFLVHSTNENDQFIAGFTFVKKRSETRTPIPDLIEEEMKYNYMLGPGEKIGWNQSQPVRLDFCGQDRSFVPAYQYAMKTWQEALEGRLDFVGEVLDNPPPFTDVNTNCIYAPEFYRRVFSGDLYNYATAWPLISNFHREIMGGFIMIHKREWNKSSHSVEAIDTKKTFTLLHEIGHFLGMHHKFDENTPSLLAYEDGTLKELQPYDKEAIETLYPLAE